MEERRGEEARDRIAPLPQLPSSSLSGRAEPTEPPLEPVRRIWSEWGDIPLPSGPYAMRLDLVVLCSVACTCHVGMLYICVSLYVFFPGLGLAPVCPFKHV